MRIFPRKRFAWKEPRDFVRAEYVELAARRKWWLKPGLCLLVSANVMAIWAIERLSPNYPVDFPTALAIAVGGGLLMVYGLPPLIALLPWTVEVFENRISWLHDGAGRCVLFKDIESAEWTIKHGFPALRIVRKGPKRREVLLGVAPEVNTKTITEFLESKGLNSARGPESLPYA
jgi:hypothetical protein